MCPLLEVPRGSNASNKGKISVTALRPFALKHLDSLVKIHKTGGAAEGTRTPDPNITNVVLYQLSYCGAPGGPGPRAGAAFTGGGPLAQGGAGANSLARTSPADILIAIGDFCEV